MKKFLAVFFVVMIALSSALATGASALGNANVMKAKNNFEFARISTDIVYSYNGNSYGNGEQGYGETLRVLGRTTDASYNFRRLGAEKCVIGADGRFLLQFKEYSAFRYALGILKNDKKIVYAEPDAVVSVGSENDSDGGYLSWGTEALGLDKYSEYISQNVGTAQGVTVAVVDTGVEDIDPLKNRLVDGYDFIENDSDAFEDTSDESHGTFVAGIIADCTGNTSVKIMPVRVIETDEAYLSIAVNGIYYAVDNGADVINISLSSPEGICSALDEAIEYADGKGVTVVACSGNFKKDTSTVCPAHIDSVITVSAVNSSLEFSSYYSDFGASVDVVAPGDNIVSYGADGNLKALNGTSMSAGFISAGAALFMLDNPDCNPSQVQLAIKSVCTDLGADGHDKYYGNGIPDFSKFIGNKYVPATGIDVSADMLNCFVGDNLTPEYAVFPSGATVKSVTYSSSNPSVAYIVNGVVYCASVGTAVITVTTVDGGFSDSVTLEVTERENPAPVPVGIHIEKSPDKVKYTYKSGETLDLSGIRIKVIYSDSSTKLVEDMQNVTVSGFSTSTAGKQTVTVEYGGFTDDFEITVGYTWWQMIIRILLLGFLWY